MEPKATSPDAYIETLSEERKLAMRQLREIINKNLPEGFTEVMAYGMLGYVVPHSIYPDGYHCTPKLPLPFISIASQKSAIVLHHLGLYGSPKLLNWFVLEYPKHAKSKLDMGKGCVRFKKMDDIPFNLIAELVGKISVSEWTSTYEANFKKK